MSLALPTYLFVAFIFILAIAIGGMIARAAYANKAIPPRSTSQATFIADLLKSLNCVYTHEVKDNWNEYSFKYQNGNFIIICKDVDDYIRIHYPHFLSTSLEHLNLIREITNACNSHNFSHHVVYTIDGEANRVNLHIISSLLINQDKSYYIPIVHENLEHFFKVAQEFYLRLERSKDKFAELRSFDVEKDFATYERELFLMKELEIRHQTPNQEHPIFTNPLTINSIIRHFYEIDNPEFLELKVVTHDLNVIVNEKDIAEFSIEKVLVSKNEDEQNAFNANAATLILTYNPEKGNTESMPQQLTIALNSEGAFKGNLYQRATLSQAPQKALKRNVYLDQERKNQYLSFLFASPTTLKEERDDYFVRLMEAGNEGKQEEKSVNAVDFALKFGTQAYNEYVEYGKTLFRENRFYEACVELEYIYQHANVHFEKFDNKGKENFYDLCFYIGLCYSYLGKYEKAYYYLDIIFSLNNYPYMEAYINCLVNAKDFRTVPIIDNLITQLKNAYAEGSDNLSEDTKRFYHFMLRRKGHYLIDMGKIEEATSIFKALYNDPESQDYALNELAYIQRKYGKKKKDESKE